MQSAVPHFIPQKYLNMIITNNNHIFTNQYLGAEYTEIPAKHG